MMMEVGRWKLGVIFGRFLFVMLKFWQKKVYQLGKLYIKKF
jgi:hypothetical protein